MGSSFRLCPESRKHEEELQFSALDRLSNQ